MLEADSNKMKNFPSVREKKQMRILIYFDNMSYKEQFGTKKASNTFFKQCLNYIQANNSEEYRKGI